MTNFSTHVSTLDDIMRQCRFRADQENSEFIADEELKSYINNSLGELWDLLVGAYPTDFFVDGYEFDTDSDLSSYDLPTDFQKCIGVDMKVDGSYYSLEHFSWAERNKYLNSTDTIVAGRPRHKFRVWRNSLYIYPGPETGYGMRLWYIPQCPKLNSTSDTIEESLVDSWIEFVIVDVAIKMMLKEESDVTALIQTKADLLQRIVASAKREQGVAEPEQDTGTTLYNLRIQARHRSNTLGKPEVVSDTELNTYINQSMWSLYDLLVGIEPETLVDGYNFSTVALKEDIDLPTDFYKMYGLDIVSPTDSKSYSLQKYNFAERNVYKNATDFIVDNVPRYRYRLLNRSIRLAPAPEAVYQMTLWYIPTLDELTNDTDTLDTRLIDAWKEYIIVEAASKIIQKTGSDPASLNATKAEIQSRITAIGSGRNLDTPEVAQDSEPTLFNLRIQARYRANMLNSDMVSDTELSHYVNQSYAELYDLLVQSYGTEHFVDGYQFTSVVSQKEYQLPDSHYRTVGLDISYGSKWHSLQKFNFNERNLYEGATDYIVDGVPRYRYRLVDEKLHVLPAPEKAYSFRMWFIPEFTKLSADTSRIDNHIVESWTEYIIIDAAIKMIIKAGGDISALAAQKQAIAERVAKMAAIRNLDNPEVTQDSEPTLFNLRIQTRHRANALNSDAITDTELNGYINNSMGELYDLLVQSYGDEAFMDGYQISTVVNQKEYQLPDDAMRITGLDMSYDSNWYSLQKFIWAERNIYENATDHIVNGIPRYRYRGVDEKFHILPAPEAVYSLRMWYIPELPKLSSDTSVLSNQIVESWSEYIIIDAAIKVKIKLGQDIAALGAQKQTVMERIARAASVGDLDTPEVVQDSGNTLFNLRIQARYCAGMIDSPAVRDTELNHYINNSLGELHDLLVKAYGNDYFIDGYEFSTSSGQEDYDLPTDFYKLGGIDVKSGGETYTLDKFNWGERNKYKASTLSRRGGSPYFMYRIMDNSVRIMPSPDGTYEMTLWYTPAPTKLTSDTDEVDKSIPTTWLEYVVLDAAIKMIVKMGRDPSALMKQKQDMLDRITQMAENRDWGTPETVTDINSQLTREWLW